MEIRYHSDYVSKDRKYSVGKVNMLSGYALQINEPRPVLTEGKLAPGEQCMILFGISQEEYDLKQSDPKAQEELASALRKNVPGDRVLMALVVDLTGKVVQKAVKVKTGASIDNGAFISRYRLKAGPLDALLLPARKLQTEAAKKDAPEDLRRQWEEARKALGAAIGKFDGSLYSPDEVLLQCRFPYVREGFVELFTTPERAEKALERSRRLNFTEDLWQLQEIKPEGLTAFIDRCVEMGLRSFKIDAYTLDVILQVNDISDRETPRNSVLRGCMLQETACGMAMEKLKGVEIPEPDRRRMTERLLTLQNFTRREVGNSILWSVCAVPDKIGGKLCTKAAAEKMDNAPGLKVIPGLNSILIAENGSANKLIPLFTSEIAAVAFIEKVNGSPRPVAVTFDDVKLMTENANQVSGIILDIESAPLRITKEQFPRIMDLRDKPRQIVRIQPPKAEAPAPANTPIPVPVQETAPVQTRVPVENSLPDPDMFDIPVPQKKAEPAAEVENSADIEAANEEIPKKEKGGFFRKLFGKGKK